MINKKGLAWIYALLMLALIVPVVWAIEHMPLGDFESGIGGWTIILANTPAQMTQSDVYARTGSWAGAHTNTNTIVGTSGFASGVVQHQCMVINNPGTSSHLTFTGYIYVPEGAENFGRFRPRIRFYETTGCATDRGGVNGTLVTTIQRGTWVQFMVIAPRPLDSAGVVAYLETDKTDINPLTVYFDDLRFYDSTPTAVSLQSFTAQYDSHRGGLGWSEEGELPAVPLFIALSLILALITLLWLRR